MDCPRCGYALSPFDKECPRCKRMAEEAAGLRPGAHQPMPGGSPKTGAAPVGYATLPMRETTCTHCGSGVPQGDRFCTHCGQPQQQGPVPGAPSPSYYPPISAPGPPADPYDAYVAGINNSGTGGPVPAEVVGMGWCWGAAGIPVIWGLVNRVWASLLVLLGSIPFLGMFLVIGVVIWLGSSGHQLAWQNRRFDSLAQFRETMAAWNSWGIAIFILNVVSLIGFFLFGFAQGLTGSG